MSELIPALVERYLDRLLPDPPAAMQAMEAEGRRARLPLIDRQVGSLLSLLCRLVDARRVLEVGTCIGYSTAWLARSLAAGGRVLSLEIDPQRAAAARKNLTRARLSARVDILVGDAGRLLERQRGRFDLLFNDGAKEQYPAVARAALRLLRPGGLLVSDNALWSGSVARRATDAATKAIQEHNAFVLSHARFDGVILPVRDGVLVARRR